MIKFEIDMALAFDRPIIPVIFNGQERAPKIARQFAWCDPVKWRGNSVREAILQFLPPHRRDAFEARIARREAAMREAERQRRAATAAAYYARTLPPAPPPEPFLRPQRLPNPFLAPANALAAYERSPASSFQTYGALEHPSPGAVSARVR